MPDGEPIPPTAPHTWRPFGARIVATLLGGLLLVLCVATWIALGAAERAKFTGPERATLVALGLLGFACWYALVRSRVTATQDALTVVNGYRKRVYEWPQILAVSLRRGAPWADVDLSDGTSISMLAIQGSDGHRAVDAVRALRRLIASHAPPDPQALC